MDRIENKFNGIVVNDEMFYPCSFDYHWQSTVFGSSSTREYGFINKDRTKLIATFDFEDICTDNFDIIELGKDEGYSDQHRNFELLNDLSEVF